MIMQQFNRMAERGSGLEHLKTVRKTRKRLPGSLKSLTTQQCSQHAAPVQGPAKSCCPEARWHAQRDGGDFAAISTSSSLESTSHET